MKAFKDVYIRIGEKNIIDYINKLTSRLENPWSRAYENEESSKYLGETSFCFKRDEDSKLPKAGLSIFQKEGDIWYIPNVFPIEVGQLSYDQYNEIITEFYENFLLPAAEENNIDVELSSGELQDEDIVGESAAKLLKTFSSCANKSTGSSHPCDQERWFAFLVEASKSDHSIDVDDLRRLLLQQGWSEQYALDLAIQFEFAMDLIQYMEK